MVRVQYFILEDGDDMNHPNVFEINDSFLVQNGVQVGKIKEYFPLPGKYHFRFMKKIGSTQVWMDTKDNNEIFPVINGVCLAKVSRISFGDNVSHSSSSSGSNNNINNNNDNQRTTNDDSGFTAFDAFGDSTSTNASSSSIQPQSSSDSDLLGMNSPPQVAIGNNTDINRTKSSSGNDLFGLGGLNNLNPTATGLPPGNANGLNGLNNSMNMMNMGNMGGGMQQPMRSVGMGGNSISMGGNRVKNIPTPSNNNNRGSFNGKKDAFSDLQSFGKK